VTLQAWTPSGWAPEASATTDGDGRVRQWSPEIESHQGGTYRLRFEVARYFAARGVSSFYPYVEVTFTVEAGERYHVPLLLSPFGYSTYRGS
jgi:5-hydroxyisourate hydrolase